MSLCEVCDYDPCRNGKQSPALVTSDPEYMWRRAEANRIIDATWRHIVAAKDAEIAKLRAMLRRLEFSPVRPGRSCCQVCLSLDDHTHKPDCELPALLGDTE